MTRVRLLAGSAATVVGLSLLYHCASRETDRQADVSATQRGTPQTALAPEVSGGGGVDDPTAADSEPLPERASDEGESSPERHAQVDDLTPAESAAENEAFFQRGIDAFESEPVDSVWASRVAARFEASLHARRLTQKFPEVRFEPVQCRTSTCALVLHIEVEGTRTVGLLDRALHAVSIDVAREEGGVFARSRSEIPHPSGRGMLVRYHFNTVRSER